MNLSTVAGIVIGAMSLLATVPVRAASAREGAEPTGSEASSLWITREQRAQQLFDTGHIAEAEQLFRDRRRRAFADARLGRDVEAARLLAPLHDARSEYDRGNALARSGQLVGALAAYDAALAQAPGDRDLRHNRDLVARVLASRAQRQPGQGNSSQSGQGQQGNRGQSSNGQPRDANAQGSPNSRSGQSPNSQSGQSPSSGGASAQQEAEQAREDAALAAAIKRRQAHAGSQSSGPMGGRAGAQGGTGRAGGGVAENDLPWPPPKSEQALALDQWLRRIPEDPGGLLRRKFLIEHMERQEAQP